MKVTVVHHITGATKTTTFEAPHITVQMPDSGFDVTLLDAEGTRTGFALFHRAGLVALEGAAAEQYGHIEKRN